MWNKPVTLKQVATIVVALALGNVVALHQISNRVDENSQQLQGRGGGVATQWSAKPFYIGSNPIHASYEIDSTITTVKANRSSSHCGARL